MATLKKKWIRFRIDSISIRFPSVRFQFLQQIFFFKFPFFPTCCGFSILFCFILFFLLLSSSSSTFFLIGRDDVFPQFSFFLKFLYKAKQETNKKTHAKKLKKIGDKKNQIKNRPIVEA